MNVVIAMALALVVCAGACQKAPDNEMEGKKMGPPPAMGGGATPGGAFGPADGGAGAKRSSVGHPGDT